MFSQVHVEHEVTSNVGGRTSNLPSPRRRTGRNGALGLLALVVTGWVDYATGGELGMSFLYLAVIITVTWQSGLRWGVSIAGLAGLVWVAALVPYKRDRDLPITSVNALSRLAIFLGAAYGTARLRSAQDDLETLNRRLEFALERETALARTDPMTGLLNRRGFSESVDRELARAQRLAEPLAIAYVDLDRFKALNDTLGHEAGDSCLHSVSSAIAGSIRRTDLAARLGGDEFAVLMPATPADAARIASERMLRNINESVRGFSSSGVSASVGLVSFELPPTSVEELLRQADSAMYQAKQAGRGRVHATLGYSPIQTV